MCAFAGHVLLLTNPISAGYTQNPISVYYCHGAAGSLVRGIAEVGRWVQQCWGHDTCLVRTLAEVDASSAGDKVRRYLVRGMAEVGGASML